MSTRSGKRLHNSPQHIISDNEAPKSERRTRSRHLKENFENDKVTKVKKRKNYVSYPTEDNETNELTESESVLSASHKTLREKNFNCSLNKSDIEPLGKCVRLTRRTKKLSENNEPNLETGIIEKNNNKKQSRKNKKKVNSAQETLDAEIASNDKKLKRKKAKKSDVVFNKSNVSTDSFHSAADSPVKEVLVKDIDKPNGSFKSNSRRASKRNSEGLSEYIESKSKKRKLSNVINDSEKIDNSNCETTRDNGGQQLDTTFEKETKNNRRSEIKNSTFDKSDTFVGGLDSTYDRNTSLHIPIVNNSKPLKSTVTPTSSLKCHNLSNSNEQKECSKPSLNPTPETDTKLNTTFEKLNGHCNIASEKSPVISDDAANLTFDKSNDNSRITITSEDSSSENIVNTTPLLIESSIDETSKSGSSITDDVSTDKSDKLSLDTEVITTIPVTPLQREGTFTKDGPDVIIVEKPKVPSQNTPVKHKALPSPGCTPYNISRSSQKEKSVLNVTHSIEKPGRQSSLVEQNPRMTKVMFCSPVNTPVIAASQTRKVIKSNLKGSNKSFIFDESVSDLGRLGRKRSFTHNDVEEAGAKRSRLTAALRQSRSRTASAAPKLSERLITPSKRQQTPSKDRPEPKVGRTKLPNFAALHQRQFAKMESLDECQERKAKRAKQLLTPTGSITVLERISPRNEDTTSAEPSKSASASKKPETPSKTPKLPTLESLRPGYNRFGFKMGSGVNPFSVTAKTDVKPKIRVVNSALTRQPSYPSLSGATSRKDVAKQTVMREKSFTSLSDKRNVKRMENRTVIKGVRTNRRFELQMRLRDLNA